MSLIEADQLAKHRKLLLILFDQSHELPDVRLMSGRQLAEIREETRSHKKEDLTNEKMTDFIVRIRSHIAENDLSTKMIQARAAYSRGCSIRFLIDFGRTIDEKETEKLVSLLYPRRQK
jgi:translation initiation factor IF-3